MRLRTFGGLAIENGAANDALVTRPRSLALLAVLATVGNRGMSRDHVLGVLWPESSPDRARHALAQTTYNLRGDLGADVVIATPVLRLDARVVTSDVDDFQQAVRERRWADAAALYTGVFLDGFYLADAPEFERWVETQRAALAVEGARAIEALAKELTDAGRLEDAARQWLRLVRAEPLNARFAISYMEACAAYGSRAVALIHGRTYCDFVKEELDAEPDGAVIALMSRLREAESIAPTATPPEPEPRMAPIEQIARSLPGVPPPEPIVRSRRRMRRISWTGVLVPTTILSVGIAMTLVWRDIATPRDVAPVLAVGRIRDLTAPDSAAPGARDVASEMLATSLGRVPELQVVASSRMIEIMARDADTSRAAVTGAARRAGATEIVEGELMPAGDGQLRLEVRRVELTRGRVRGAYAITGADRFALFDSLTARMAVALGVDAKADGVSLADISTRSPIAYRLYEDGLRAFYQFDLAAAKRLFRAAIREDSTFAMATYYAWRTAVESNDSTQVTLGRRAMRLALHASERDRLLIRTYVGQRDEDLGALSAAESLVTRYPRDPEGLMRAAQVMTDRSRARSLLVRSIAIDSAAGVRPGAICRMCDALRALSFEYQWVDSMAASEHALRRWIALRPDDNQPWTLLADLIVGLGRAKEAVVAQRRSISMGLSPGDTTEGNLIWALRSDNFDALDAQCPRALATADSVRLLAYRWYCLIGLRMEGRYTDALALVRDGRIPRTETTRPMAVDSFHTAILTMEMGRPLQAADQFEAMARLAARDAHASDAMRAHNTAWLLTLSATAAVAGNDTARALRMVDSIEAIGRRSLFGRDPQLHHFVRGLVLSHERQDSRAARELEASIYSPTHGYTRANYELGRTLVRLGRPGDAIEIVGAALRGGIDGSTLYVTRTQMHELLAQLFDATGQADSAAAHYAVVERAWRSADPFLQASHDRAAQRLSRLRRSR